MSSYLKWVIFSAALLALPVGAADPPTRLAELPVVDSKLVPPEKYEAASDFAARGNSPLDIALKIVGAFKGSTQHIIQVNRSSETPSASRITVLRDGLMDDSVRSERWDIALERWDIALERTSESIWSIKEVRRSWRCWRGEKPNRFASMLCP